MDDFDTYLHVIRITYINMLVADTTTIKLEIHKMDVKITFLNGELDKEIYMTQLEGFIV